MGGKVEDVGGEVSAVRSIKPAFVGRAMRPGDVKGRS